MKIKLYYACFDGGDGSASPNFFKTRAELDAAVEAQEAVETYNLADSDFMIIDTDGYEVVE